MEKLMMEKCGVRICGQINNKFLISQSNEFVIMLLWPIIIFFLIYIYTIS